MQQQAAPAEPQEKPDANMCLKYTFGVNAWKQWVTFKNAELEKSSRRVKLFKTEILQLTADELNYSLCLFVKEVRKPNGAEYAPDTIYYLCLGSFHVQSYSPYKEMHLNFHQNLIDFSEHLKLRCSVICIMNRNKNQNFSFK